MHGQRSLVEHPQQWLLSPGLKEAPVLDLMCSHFVLNLAARQGAKFNVRRDLNSLLSLSGRHLVWPLPALRRFTFKISFMPLTAEQREKCSSPRRWLAMRRCSRRT